MYDDIPAELIKARHNNRSTVLLHNKIQTEEIIPNNWLVGVIIKIPKKDVSSCKNWRPMLLLCSSSKIILIRIKSQIEKELRQNQVRFRTQRACLNQI